jgi:hypothetical protein
VSFHPVLPSGGCGGTVDDRRLLRRWACVKVLGTTRVDPYLTLCQIRVVVGTPGDLKSTITSRIATACRASPR